MSQPTAPQPSNSQPSNSQPSNSQPSNSGAGSVSKATEPTDPGTVVERRAEVARRRARDRIFGDVLPDRSADEIDEGGPSGRDSSAGEDWLRANVPPHHG